MNCNCTILKTQCLGKPLLANHLANSEQSKVRRLMVSFSSNIEHSLIVLKIPKKLLTSLYKNVYASKCLTKEEKDIGSTYVKNAKN